MSDNIISYIEMCRREAISLQQGMNFGIGGNHSVILMSIRRNAPYRDRLEDGGTTLIYEGHDQPKSPQFPNPKVIDQSERFPSGALTQNGRFHDAAQHVRRNEGSAVRMSLDLERFRKFRPWLFHLTARANLCVIRATGMIESAGTLLRRAGHVELLMVRRGPHRPIEVDSHQVLIRDQKPLHAGAIAFELGWDLPRFVQHVNEHVFFWPGTLTGPIKPGLNHYQRYADEQLAIVRVQLRSLLRINSGTEPLFSKFNSGAPRVVNGKPSPRGSSTYRDRHTFDGGVSDVIEVVFLNRIVLPSDIQVSPSYSGPWEDL